MKARRARFVGKDIQTFGPSLGPSLKRTPLAGSAASVGPCRGRCRRRWAEDPFIDPLWAPIDPHLLDDLSRNPFNAPCPGRTMMRKLKKSCLIKSGGRLFFFCCFFFTYFSQKVFCFVFFLLAGYDLLQGCKENAL